MILITQPLAPRTVGERRLPELRATQPGYGWITFVRLWTLDLVSGHVSGTNGTFLNRYVQVFAGDRSL